MARQKVKVKGLRELQRGLKTLPKATSKNVLRRALKKAGEPVESDAERRVHVDQGDLKESIEVSTKLSKRQARIHRREVGTMPKLTIAGFKSEPAKGVFVFVGTGQLPQAHMEEFGTRHQAPHPYLRPSWDSNKMKSLGLARREIKTELDKAVRRLERKAAREAAKAKSGN